MRKQKVSVLMHIPDNVSKAVKAYQKAQRRAGIRPSRKPEILAMCIEFGLKDLAKEAESLLAVTNKITTEEIVKQIHG